VGLPNSNSGTIEISQNKKGARVNSATKVAVEEKLIPIKRLIREILEIAKKEYHIEKKELKRSCH